MIIFSTLIFPDFKNRRVKTPANLANGAVLERPILTLIEIKGMLKDFSGFFKTDPALRITSESCALSLVKLEAHARTL